MKTLFSLLLILLAKITLAQNPNYDSTFAKKLGGDDFGMKKYYLVILKSGENLVKDKAYRDSCFKSHFENMKKMEEAGKLVVSGPITSNNKGYRGIFILNASKREEVIALLQGDATINVKIFEPEILEWYGSSALPMYLEHTDKIWKKKF
jgi:uncharacterized protein YciI